METAASCSMPSTETGGSEVAERFTVKKFGESAEAWSDRTNWPEGMLNVLVRAGVHRFLFGQFNFNNEEIDNVISSYDYELNELIIFGRRVCLDPDLLSSATKIPRRGGVMLTTKKTLKVEKAEMANKICGKTVLVARNGLRMQDVPPGLYKTLIQIVLRTIMNHHNQDITGDCMKLVIHWVEDLAIDVPHLLAKKMHFALQESKMKKVKFSYPGTLQKIVDLYRPSNVEGSRFKNTYLRRWSLDKINKEVPQQSPTDNVQVPERPFEYCMQGIGSDPEELDAVSILAGLHEGKEMNVNEMHDVEFNQQEEHSDDDIYGPAEMPLVIYTPPQLGVEKTSSSKYFFDGKIVFKLFDEMLHFKEQAEFQRKNFSYWYLTAVQSQELCRIKQMQIKDLLKVIARLETEHVDTMDSSIKNLQMLDLFKEIARLQDSLVKTVDSSRRTIEKKDFALQSLDKELERIADEFKKENEKCKVEFLVSHTKDEQTIKRLQDELKHRPEVLDIPPLDTVMGQEAKLVAEVEMKNRVIERMKAQFASRLAEIDNEHKVEINEYRKKEENMKNIIAKKDEELKGKTVEPEKITAERYDVSAHQQALIMYESSLQNREKALDVAFKEIEAHEKVKKGLQSYRAFLRTREKSLMDAIAAMNAGADLSAWSTTNETFKKKIAEKEDEIKELKKKLLENRESKHLGCKSEIEDLKSQIATLKKNSILQRVGVVYTPDITDLRAKELETEAEQLRKENTHVHTDLRYAKERLKQKEKEQEEKNRKNAQLMKKYIEDKDRLNESLMKCAKKVKELEQKLEHAPVAASQEPEASGQGKRLECTNLSSLEGDLQPKPPKQARTME